jgi:hypothetical protein
MYLTPVDLYTLTDDTHPPDPSQPRPEDLEGAFAHPIEYSTLEYILAYMYMMYVCYVGSVG